MCGSFHSMSCSGESSILSHEEVVYSFSFLYSSSLYECMANLSIIVLMKRHLECFQFELFWIKRLRISMVLVNLGHTSVGYILRELEFWSHGGKDKLVFSRFCQELSKRFVLTCISVSHVSSQCFTWSLLNICQSFSFITMITMLYFWIVVSIYIFWTLFSNVYYFDILIYEIFVEAFYSFSFLTKQTFSYWF